MPGLPYSARHPYPRRYPSTGRASLPVAGRSRHPPKEHLPVRTHLALAGLAVGVAAALAPLAPASANCQPPPVDTGKPCMDDGCDNYDALAARIGALPDRPFECTQ
jgi:hypothetical protein